MRPARANDLSFPFNQRFVVAGWKLLVPSARRPTSRTARKARNGTAAPIWSKGLAHCGACHTPRNVARRGASRARRFPAATSTTGMPMRSTRSRLRRCRGTTEALFQLSAPWLASRSRRGARADGRGGRATCRRCRRATSTRSRPIWPACSARPTPDRLRQASERAGANQIAPAQPVAGRRAGASIYAAACATCHETDRPLPYGGINLGLSTALSAPDPRNAANIILSGIRPVEGERSPIMPGFASSMTDAADCGAC